jgi:ATPase family AAA domain-containing protein 3A/B
MFAKGLARDSGLEYAIMTGGDIAPLGKDAVTEIHKLFDWAKTSSKGVLIFVDEADAFLRKRSTERISEDMRNALNAFLYRTGEASDKFMLVYASNQPEQFDWAVNDRIDEMVEFGLPTYDERLRMITLYMDRYLLHPPSGSKQIIVNEVEDATLHSFAVATEGYSGREVSKLAIAWQAAAYGTSNATIGLELLSQVLAESKESKRQKLAWIGPVDAEKWVRSSS